MLIVFQRLGFGSTLINSSVKDQKSVTAVHMRGLLPRKNAWATCLLCVFASFVTEWRAWKSHPQENAADVISWCDFLPAV